jgi:hypothetical protein
MNFADSPQLHVATDPSQIEELSQVASKRGKVFFVLAQVHF